MEVEMKFKDLFNFDKMLTPLIIKILYYIGIGCSVISGLVMFFGGFVRAFGRGGGFLSGLGSIIGGMFGSILVVVLGILMVRICSELIIILFQNNQNLTDIKNKVVDDAKVVDDDKKVVDEAKIVDDVEVVVEEKPLSE